MQQPITIKQSNAFIELFDLEPYQKGELSGLTFAVKDSIDIANHKTGRGNPTWLKSTPQCAENAICVDLLLSHGATCLGKTITDEFTYSLDGENVHYGTPLNPKAPDRVPGGSSSGSASAVACGIVDFALGTDCGGSVRVPASNCGIYGMRPSTDKVSTAGVMPLAPSFDTVGILANSNETLVKTASALYSLEPPLDIDIGHIYIPKEVLALCDKEILKEFEFVIDRLKNTYPGKIKEISLHMLVEEFSAIPLQHWLECFSLCQCSEIWSTHGTWIENTKPDLGSRIKGNFEYAKQIDRKLLAPAVARREWYFNLMSDFLKPNDLLCFPTTPKLAPLKNSLGTNRYEDEYYEKTLSVCSIAGICRLPQISLPLMAVDGVPVGLSFVGWHGSDDFLLWKIGELENSIK